MRCFWPAHPLALVVLVPVALVPVALVPVVLVPVARADTFQFSFAGDYQPPVIPGFDPLGGGPTLTLELQLSGPPTFFLYDGQFPAYQYASLPVSSSAGAMNTVSNLMLDPNDVGFYTMNGSLTDVYGIANLATTLPFSTGPASDPVYLPGSYQAEFEYRDYSIYDGTLTIADLSTVTPEPATFVLLGTGLLGGAAAVRRRLALSRAAHMWLLPHPGASGTLIRRIEARSSVG